jgi:acetolactate synthase-1/2/3 large subunit
VKKTGAWLTRYALESIGVTHTFGIPGLHNTPIYDELDQSEQISPCLVTHEVSAAFMADAVSRTTNTIGTLVIVPGAGITHASSGIGEAFLDGIPLLIIAGGIDRSSDNQFQAQDIDHHALLAPITKATFLVENHADIAPTLFEAYRTALEGEPGPVFVEIPINVQLASDEIGELPIFNAQPTTPDPDMKAIEAAVSMLLAAKNPGIFVGWGAKGASDTIQALATHLATPVATTLQGLSVFPANHPLHTGMGFGPSSVPAAQNAFKGCDCLLALATRFAETPTGNFGMVPPENLIHVDINPAVFNANYPATITLQGDALEIAKILLEKITSRQTKPRDSEMLIQQIASDKHSYRTTWRQHTTDRVNPANFFNALRERLPDDALVACDDGNHTYLSAELFPIHRVGGFISPTDFNAMGYCVPAVNALKLSHPDTTVVGIIGDGAMMMTGMEALTASKYNLGVIYFLFNDGELAQIAQAQEIPYKRKTCTKLGEADWIAFSQAVGCEYVAIEDDSQLQPALDTAFSLAADNKPVVVDVHIDYSKHTAFMEGAVKTRYKRFDRSTKARYLARALTRKIIGSK